jgi:hypothetical protein
MTILVLIGLILNLISYRWVTHYRHEKQEKYLFGR